MCQALSYRKQSGQSGFLWPDPDLLHRPIPASPLPSCVWMLPHHALFPSVPLHLPFPLAVRLFLSFFTQQTCSSLKTHGSLWSPLVLPWAELRPSPLSVHPVTAIGIEPALVAPGFFVWLPTSGECLHHHDHSTCLLCPHHLALCLALASSQEMCFDLDIILQVERLGFKSQPHHPSQLYLEKSFPLWATISSAVGEDWSICDEFSFTSGNLMWFQKYLPPREFGVHTEAILYPSFQRLETTQLVDE